jgi:hypothetical protein
LQADFARDGSVPFQTVNHAVGDTHGVA